MSAVHRSSLRAPAAALVAAILVGIAAPAAALPVGSEDDVHESLRDAPSWAELDAAAVDFTAIVALSNCSGSLVRFTTSRTDDKAMVLTNGHCLSGFVDANDAVVSEPSTRTFSLLSSSGRSSLGTLRASEIVYATMTGSDFALYRLTQTYAQIAARYGVSPLIISDRHPEVGAPVRIVSGYWRRIYSCSIDRFAYQLKEGSWTFSDSIRFSQPGCETIGGTSGSPIIHADTRAVIGINNTGNQSGGRCTLNNPCEIDERGTVTAHKGASYGQELYQIYSCLDANNEIDLNRAGCRLNKPL
jgi:hypothetical protein